MSSKITNDKVLVIATRLHLGNASSPPDEKQLLSTLENFGSLASLVPGSVTSVIAVDGTPKIDKYDYVEAIRNLLPKNSSIEILPVTPWGKFVPALNALVHHARQNLQADQILFVSAEVNASASAIQTLRTNLEDEDTIVAGAVMRGHMYAGDQEEEVALNGRTTPWNTMAVWNLKWLSLTGFQLVSDLGSSSGVEECVAISLLQKLFPVLQAKLVKLDDIDWDETFQDEDRRKWHEHKMKSKLDRAQQQMDALQLKGVVRHC